MAGNRRLCRGFFKDGNEGTSKAHGGGLIVREGGLKGSPCFKRFRARLQGVGVLG